MKKVCVYEDIKFHQGWYEPSLSHRYDTIAKFLGDCVGEEVDPNGDESAWKFFQEVEFIEGKRGGRAKEVLTFKGRAFEVDRKPLETYHGSQKGRWEIRVKFLG